MPATNDLCHCWSPTIIKAGSGRGIATTGLLSAALATIAMLAISWASDRAGHFLVSFGLLIVAAGAMAAAYGPYFALIPELLLANVAG